MSIPSIFAPTEINNKLLVDGGIINNYPVDVAKEMGADIIIGVDIQTKPLEKDEIQDLTDILGQIFSYMGYDKYIENKKQSDILIEPDISGYGTGSFSNSAADTLIKRGREATLLKINEIKKLLSKNKIPLKKEIRNYSYDEEFNINYFMVGGLKENSAYYTLEKTKYNFPSNYNFEIIDEGINRLYGTNSFNKAYFRINGSDIKTLGLIVKEKNTNTMNAGFNFNSTDKASILVNFTFRNQILKGSRLSLDAKLSTNTMFGASYQISASSLPELYLGGVFKNFNVSIYDKDKKVASSDVQYLDGELSIIDVFGSNYLINFGIQGEYYKIDPLFSEDNKISFTSNENTTLSIFGKIRFDNLDDKFYPTRGFDLYTKFSYSSNKADNIIKNTTTPILLYSFKTAIKMGSDVSFIPHFYGRLLLNENTDIFMRNAIGGTEAERLLDFNLPFIGIKRVVFTKDKTFIAKGELRIRINDNNYLSFIANGLSHFSKFSDWKTRELLGGLGINYSFKSLIGPIDVLASTSDYTKDFAFFINVGRWF
jgi:NTE family protein